MTNGIYGYYDVKNQYVVYIGQDAHIDKKKRHKDHLSPSNYDGQHINRVLQNNPDRYVYFKFIKGDYAQDEIDDLEKEAIKLFKTYKYDYPERNVFNFTIGGDINPMYGKKHSKETIAKMSGENHPMYGKTGKNHPMYGRKHSDETKNKMSLNLSKKHNTSGYYRVSKQKYSTYKQGFIWKYQYTENGKHKAISSVDIKKLEKKVKDKGLKWEKI